MDITALFEGGGEYASFGSGNGSRAANARAAGSGGRRKASAGSHRAVASSANRLLGQVSGRGSKAHKAALKEISAQAGGSRLTEKQLASLRSKMAEIRRAHNASAPRIGVRLARGRG